MTWKMSNYSFFVVQRCPYSWINGAVLQVSQGAVCREQPWCCPGGTWCLPPCSGSAHFEPQSLTFWSLSKKQPWNFIGSISFLCIPAVENNYQQDWTGQPGHDSQLQCVAFHLHFKKIDWSIKMYVLILSRVLVAAKEQLKVSGKRLGRVGADTWEHQDYSILQ